MFSLTKEILPTVAAAENSWCNESLATAGIGVPAASRPIPRAMDTPDGFMNRSFPSPPLYRTREPSKNEVNLREWCMGVAARIVRTYSV